MDFMTCTTCRKVVQVNATGICIQCQKGFSQAPEEDCFNVENQREIEKLQAKQKEIEDALQVKTAGKMDVGHPSRNGEKVGKRNAKKRKTS